MTARSREPRAELAKVASRARSRVREQHRLHPLAAEPFDQACRFRRDGIPVTWATNGRLFLIDVTAPSGIVLAAGRPDEILGASQPVGVAAGTVIFRCAAFSPTGWLSQLEHSSLIAALGLSANEQLLVARSGATLVVEPRGLEGESTDYASTRPRSRPSFNSSCRCSAPGPPETTQSAPIGLHPQPRMTCGS